MNRDQMSRRGAGDGGTGVLELGQDVFQPLRRPRRSEDPGWMESGLQDSDETAWSPPQPAPCGAPRDGVQRGFVGHRGLQAAGPENTLKAVTEAGRRGFVMCEVDPGISADGVWFLMHDSTVDRTTDGSGRLSALTAERIDALTVVGHGGLVAPEETLHPPRFAAVVQEAAFWGMGLNVDGGKFRWDQHLAETLWMMLLEGGIAHRSAISLPRAADRATFARFAPALPVIWASSVSTVDEDLIAAKKRHRDPIMAYPSSTLSEAVIRRCSAAGVPVYVWAADDFSLANRWLRAGATFIETDCELPGGMW
jgi:glycerophosphoryl diester phosphodiesterase